MKKLPEGSEATAVLVGAVDFLKQPTIAFVRLAQGVMMDNLVEVRVLCVYVSFFFVPPYPSFVEVRVLCVSFLCPFFLSKF